MTFLCRLVLVLLGTLGVVLVHAQSTADITQAHLNFTTIDVPGGYVYNNVAGINTAGTVVGSYSPNDNSGLDKHGFIYSNGTFTYFDYPGADSTFVQGINDSGLIVGFAEFLGGLITHGFLYDGTTFMPFDVPGEPQTYPFGINNAGDVVGAAGDAGSLVKAFEMHNGHFRVIDFPGQSLTEAAIGINNWGDIAGYTIDGIPENAYLYKNGAFKKIAVPRAPDESRAQGINDDGIVVGVYFVLGSGDCYGFAYQRRKYRSFAYPGGICTGGEGINASGQIVGQYQLPDYTWHGFVTSPITNADFQ